jgi:ribosomal protein L20A (L18A)
MKNELIFGIIGAIGTLVLYLFDKEVFAVAFGGIVYGIYERFSSNEKVKEKEVEIQSLKEENEALRELNRGLRK